MSSGLWVTAMYLAGSAWGIEIYFFNALMQAMSFAIIAILLSDIATRLGGDEFALLLMDTDSEGAKTVLERISKLLLETMRQHQWPISASIGAISFHQAPDTIEQAVHAADALMYRVKAMGKGQVLVEVIG